MKFKAGDILSYCGSVRPLPLLKIKVTSNTNYRLSGIVIESDDSRHPVGHTDNCWNRLVFKLDLNYTRLEKLNDI
jgi:hypothetical protein